MGRSIYTRNTRRVCFTRCSDIRASIITKQDDYSILDKNKVIDGEKMIATYDIIKHNAQGIELPTDAVQQRKVEGELL